MAGQILVPLKRHDRIEEIIPYLEKLAKPGMRVVFLFRYPVDSWLYLRDHWVTTESSREAMLAGKKVIDHYSWDVQRGLAEQKISLARKALQERGIEVAIEIYTGSWRRLMDDYKANGDVHFIMMHAASGHLMIRLLRRMMLPFGLFKPPSFPPVVLLHPH
jgi:hypothetical protein